MTTENSPTPKRQEDMELEHLLIKRLDSCWCDDGRLLPECPKCVAIRVLLNVLQGKT